MGLRSRLSSLSEATEDLEVEPQPLTPMNLRFIAALESISVMNPTFGVFARKFANMARKKPIPDEVLAESLQWAQSMIQGILTGATPSEVSPLSVVPEYVPEEDAEDLESLLSTVPAFEPEDVEAVTDAS